VSPAGRSGLCFECTGCGDCCTNRGEYAYVYVNREEARQIAAHLGITTRSFQRRYTFRDEDGFRQIKVDAHACVFFDAETRGCRVYPARPAQCRTFPFWPELIRRGRFTTEARRLCEGVGRGPRHSLEHAHTQMAELAEAERQD